jgi:hypothetical protein
VGVFKLLSLLFYEPGGGRVANEFSLHSQTEKEFLSLFDMDRDVIKLAKSTFTLNSFPQNFQYTVPANYGLFIYKATLVPKK